MAGVAERLGLYLTVVDLDVDGASLSAGAWGAAVIGGGARVEPGRRRMTAAHELGHHVLGDEYSSDVGVAASRDERETVVQAFAAELLLPASVVQARLASCDDAAQHAVLVALAGEYRVSWSVAVTTAEQAGSGAVVWAPLAADVARRNLDLGSALRRVQQWRRRARTLESYFRLCTRRISRFSLGRWRQLEPHGACEAFRAARPVLGARLSCPIINSDDARAPRMGEEWATQRRAGRSGHSPSRPFVTTCTAPI